MQNVQFHFILQLQIHFIISFVHAIFTSLLNFNSLCYFTIHVTAGLKSLYS